MTEQGLQGEHANSSYAAIVALPPNFRIDADLDRYGRENGGYVSEIYIAAPSKVVLLIQETNIEWRISPNSVASSPAIE